MKLFIWAEVIIYRYLYPKLSLSCKGLQPEMYNINDLDKEWQAVITEH